MSHNPHTNYAFTGIRTRSMSTRAALVVDEHGNPTPAHKNRSGVTRRTKSPEKPRVPLQEALLNLAKDGSPVKPRHHPPPQHARAESSENQPPTASPLGSPPRRPPSTATTTPPLPLSPSKLSLQETLLRLNKDGSPKSASRIATSISPTKTKVPMQAALLSLAQATSTPRSDPPEDTDNPFYAPLPSPPTAVQSPTKKRAADQLEPDADPKRARITHSNSADLAPIMRKIDFLTSKRPRSPSPPLTPVGEQDADRSPTKRVKLTPPSPPPTARVGEGIPHIDLLRPPPSPVKQPMMGSPAKFERVPRLEVGPPVRAGWTFGSPAKGGLEAKMEVDVEVPDSAIDPSLLALPPPSPSPLTLSDLSLPPPSASTSSARPMSPPSRPLASRLPVRSTRLHPNPPPRPPSSYRPLLPVLQMPTIPSERLLSSPSPAPPSRHMHMPPPPPAPQDWARTSLSHETQQSLSTLSAALSKLTLPPPAAAGPGARAREELSRRASTSTRPTQTQAAPAPPTRPGHKRRSSIMRVPLGVSTNQPEGSVGNAGGTLGASANGSGGRAPLAGCVVFVDVRTKEGDDAGGVFVEMLKSLGARVLKSPTPSLTHLVLKSPLPSTLTRFHSLPHPRAEAVAVGWVVRCAEENRLIPPDEWRLDLGVGGGVSNLPGARRVSAGGRGRGGRGAGAGRQAGRRSMEPRRVELLDEVSLTQIIPPMQEKIERLKRRSMMYQPKFSSPLRGSFFPSHDDAPEDAAAPAGKENLAVSVSVSEEGKGKARAA